MIDCKCKQGTIYLAKVLFCNWRCHVRKHYTALQNIYSFANDRNIYMQVHYHGMTQAWFLSSFIHCLVPSTIILTYSSEWSSSYSLRSSPNIWLWLDCVWILINIFLWHYKRHLYTHTLFQMSPYHVVCIFVTYIWIMCYGAICILQKNKIKLHYKLRIMRFLC